MSTLLTYKIKHNRKFSADLRKARQIAEYAIKTRSNTSKDVKHIGLKSMIANQILRKYGRNKKAKKVSQVNLIVPSQGISVDRALRLISIPCLKLKLSYYFSDFEKINQIELDGEYVYVTTTRRDVNLVDNGKYIGVDLNATGHVAVASDSDTGKVWKLGKEANYLALKYREIRRQLSRQSKYKKIKQIKNRQQRLIRNLNHHISKKVVDIAKTANKGIRLEKLTMIRESQDSKNISLFLEQLVILSATKDDRIQGQVAWNNSFIYRPTIHIENMQQMWSYGKQRGQEFQVP